MVTLARLKPRRYTIILKERATKMAKSAAEIVEEYLSDDAKRWAKLASEVNWRRLELLLLREILLELKKLNQGRSAR